MALTIDPDDVPNRGFLVFEDPDVDRWMVPGKVDVRNSDGSSATYDLDDGAGAAYRIGTSTGELYFRLDLDGGGIVTGVTGPTVGVSLPADTATEVYFHVATLTSTAAADFLQLMEGPVRWQNSGEGPRWGATPIIFHKSDGGGGVVEVGRILMDRGMPMMNAPLAIQVDAAGTSYPSSYVVTPSAGTMGVQTFNLESVAGPNRYHRAVGNPDLILLHDTALGDARIYEESTGEFVLQRLTPDITTAAGADYQATYYGWDNYNGGVDWTAAAV